MLLLIYMPIPVNANAAGELMPVAGTMTMTMTKSGNFIALERGPAKQKNRTQKDFEFFFVMGDAHAFAIRVLVFFPLFSCSR